MARRASGRSPVKERKHDLDRFDLALLNIVQENNQLTSDQLADKVGLSATACQRRLKRMRAEGAISADVSLVSRTAIGPNVTLIVMVSLEREQLDLPRQVQAPDLHVSRGDAMLLCNGKRRFHTGGVCAHHGGLW